jgi:hypothetical protein
VGTGIDQDHLGGNGNENENASKKTRARVYQLKTSSASQTSSALKKNPTTKRRIQTSRLRELLLLLLHYRLIMGSR